MASPRWIGWLLGLSLLAIPLSGVAQTIEALFERGEAAYEAGRYQEAEEIWQDISQRDSENRSARYQLRRTREQLNGET